ncbi:MAG: hypothetical protein N2167_10130 [Flavobacteriales bacterium]|nr:hypothetical protein [Flavobacteriales bacterium]
MSIVLSYPVWFLLFCFAGGLLYAAVLYYRNKKTTVFPQHIQWILAGARFLVISILLFFLLSPMIRRFYRQVEKPAIVVLLDNSSSILLNKDSVFYRSVFPGKVEQFIDNLMNKYDVASYLFDEQITENKIWDFSGQQTDISQALEDITIRYANRNLGAVILMSDGLFNKGVNPYYRAAELQAPVYVVALGDSTRPRDLLVKDVMYNQVVYLGNDFPMEVQLEASRYKGKETELTVSKNGQTVYIKKIQIPNDAYSTQVIIPAITADKPGNMKLSISLRPLEGEVTRVNNYRDIFVEVIDSRQKILLLAEAPHPDLGAIMQTIAANKNYQGEVGFLPQFNKSINAYSLIILHQIPTASNSGAQIISAARTAGVPLLFILSSSTQIPAFNQLSIGLRINGNRGNMDEVLASWNGNFSLFTLSEQARRLFSKFPPLVSPFGSSYETSAGFMPLFYRKIGSTITDQPLMGFSNLNGQKSGVIAGEGIWRWRLYNFQQQGNHEVFDELISKTIQYLAVKEDKSLFRIQVKNQYWENEPVIIDAELYNESYELINEPEVKLDVTGENNTTYSFVFSRYGNMYRLDAGRIPVGEYKYVASTLMGGKSYKKQGTIVVKPIQVEAVNTIANIELLRSIAESTGAALFMPNQLDELQKRIEATETITSRSYSQKQLRDLIHFRWIFFLLLALLSLEWLIRKRQGAY